MTTNPTSPYSSSGGGTRFEHRVGAMFLAKLLTGSVISELGDQPATRIGFQQVTVSPVDDLLIVAEHGPGSKTVRLALACRRRPHFVQSHDKTKDLFVSLVRADAAASTSDDVDDRIGVVVAGSQGGAEEVAELARVARHQISASDFFTLINESGQFSQPLQSRLKHIVALVAHAVEVIADSATESPEERSWSLLGRLYILTPALESPNESDWASLIDLLVPWSAELTPKSAMALRNQLDQVAADFGQTAANIDANVLRRRLHRYIDSNAHRSSTGWKRLLALDQQARSAVPRVLRGSSADAPLVLPRTEMRARLTEAIQEPDVNLVISGESGVGKSTAVLDAVEPSSLGADFEALVINLRDLPETPLEVIAALSEPLDFLLGGLTAPHRVLVVDAADAASINRRELFSHILRAAVAGGVRLVAVVATESAGPVSDLMKAEGLTVATHTIPSLADDEIVEAARHFPELERLAQDPKGRELLRRPIVIELLARAGNPGVPLSDADALNHIWQELVRNRERRDAGSPEAREETMLKLGEHALFGGSVDSVIKALDPDAVAGLRQSALLRPRGQLPWERLPAFSHDLLRAYAIARRLATNRSPASELKGANAPRWALPAARLACELLLSEADGPENPAAGRFARLQASFDQLAASPWGVRWADVPTEAMLAIANPLPIIRDAWNALLEDKAAGVHRLVRLLRLRYEREGILDPYIADPVIAQLVYEGTPPALGEEATDLVQAWLTAHIWKRTPSGHPIRCALSHSITERCAESERELDRQDAEARAARARRSPEEIAEEEERRKRFAGLVDIGASAGRRRRRPARRRPYEWIEETAIGHLGLLGPDLGSDGEAILRRIAQDEPESLAHAVETPLAGQALADYDSAFLVELVEAYYLEGDEDDEDDEGIGYGGWREDGIRDHRVGPVFGPLAAYYRGPFLAMFRNDFRRGVACLNRLLNHAARYRVRTLEGLERSRSEEPDEASYKTELSIAGEPRTYIGDDHVWYWYRGTSVGPYPCMSALQALEVVTDELLENLGIPAGRLAPLLLEGAESLAMPGVVLGILVRHLETAGDAIDPFLIEPAIWELEFARSIHERSSGLAAKVPGLRGLDRREWSLREVATVLTLGAGAARADQLRALGEQLISAARKRVGEDASPAAKQHIATVRKWAATLDATAYHVEEEEGHLVFQQQIDPEIEKVLAETNADLARGNEAIGLLVRHAHPRDDGGVAPDMGSEQLESDLELAQDLLANPPATAAGGSPDGPLAVAATALELHFARGVEVSDENLKWAATTLLSVAGSLIQAPRDVFDDSLFIQAPDRSAGRALPYLLLPAADRLRQSLGISTAEDLDDLVSLSRAVAWGGSNEARLAFARSLDLVWASPCSADFTRGCQHDVALELVEASCQHCVLGEWNNELQRRSTVELEGPVADSLAKVGGDQIIVRRLSPAIRALGTAANSTACCQPAAQGALVALLDAHRRAMLAHDGYHHSDSDSLIAARAALRQATGGWDTPLLDHIDAYLGHSRMLSEALKATNAAGEERTDAAAATRRLWPSIMDRVLDAAAATPEIFNRRHWGDDALASVIPNPAYAFGYLTLEFEGQPLKWRALLAWSTQVERWLAFASGNRKCIDQLVIALKELSEDDQVETGLRWIEELVATGDCSGTYTLPEWLHERRRDLLTPEQHSRWQRIVDVLVVAGDRRVADLAD